MLFFAGLLRGGYGAASRVLSRFIVLYNIPAQDLGQPRPVTSPVEPDEDSDSVSDDDRPKADSEPVVHPELEGAQAGFSVLWVHFQIFLL